MKVFVLHAPQDDIGSRPDGKGEATELRDYLAAGLHGTGVEIRLSGDVEAGAETDTWKADAMGAKVILLLMTIDLLNTVDDLSDTWDAWLKLHQTQALTLLPVRLRHCPYPQVLPHYTMASFPDATHWVCSAGQDKAALYTSLAEKVKQLVVGQMAPLVPEAHTVLPQAQVGKVAEIFLHLNYEHQPGQLNELLFGLAKKMPVCCLLHGHLHRLSTDWLFWRLLGQVNDPNPIVVNVDVNDPCVSVYQAGLLWELAERLGLPYESTYAELKNALLARMAQTRTTYVLRFDNAEDLLLDTVHAPFDAFLQEFWNPLADAIANSAAIQQNGSRLLAFFIARKDLDTSTLFEDAATCEAPHPARLAKVAPFDKPLLTQWVQVNLNAFHALPGKKPDTLLAKADRATAIDTLLQKTKGSPELIFLDLAKGCGTDFRTLIDAIQPKHHAPQN